jgi:hypothetical protein
MLDKHQSRATHGNEEVKAVEMIEVSLGTNGRRYNCVLFFGF